MGIFCGCFPTRSRITAKKLIPWILALQTAAALILLLINARSLVVSAAFVAYIGLCRRRRKPNRLAREIPLLPLL